MYKFFKLELEIDSLIIGERIKGGVFRPCIDTIPSTTIEGALYNNFGLDLNLKAVGILDKDTYEYAEFTYSITDRYTMVSKIPITTQYLKPKKDKIKADVYIPYNRDKEDIINSLKGKEFMLGAMKSKGFGNCLIKNVDNIDSNIVQGELKVRVLEEEAEDFCIKVLAANYGYLFKPDIDKDRLTGKYVRALFEGSIVIAPNILVRKESYYDYE
ncbi:MAG: hypothetical protein KatS3mg003_2233 [Candidatus Nitrosocaldaceae archaeon]|nr:MAG: hypothetical protein KatS3mg003_2165 [Candidatus Nitrosocaldaceae archaeon]GIU72754.1 MAG: hypothetical protein KatS3mg003_2233 [Candidatus Nitrosocaldaceae archaeon]